MAQRKHEAEPGDLIEIFCSGYQHWAIYIGDDKVVHMTTPGNGGNRSTGSVAEVKCENIWDVVGSCEFKINNLLDDKHEPRNPDVIVKEASDMVGKKLPCPVTEQNCRGFVTLRRNGEVESEQNLKPGDLIEIFRQGYQHWAVYVGDDEVIHLTSAGNRSSGSLFSSISYGSVAEVKSEKIWDVAGRCKFKVNNRLDNKHKPRDPDVIVKQAYEMVGKKLRYSVTEQNCEHFVTFLRYGEPLSEQVEKRDCFN